MAGRNRFRVRSFPFLVIIWGLISCTQGSGLPGTEVPLDQVGSQGSALSPPTTTGSTEGGYEEERYLCTQPDQIICMDMSYLKMGIFAQETGGNRLVIKGQVCHWDCPYPEAQIHECCIPRSGAELMAKIPELDLSDTALSDVNGCFYLAMDAPELDQPTVQVQMTYLAEEQEKFIAALEPGPETERIYGCSAPAPQPPPEEESFQLEPVVQY